MSWSPRNYMIYDDFHPNKKENPNDANQNKTLSNKAHRI